MFTLNRTKFSAWSLFLIAALAVGSIPSSVPALAEPTLVQTINTGAGSSWGPTYSPDPSGITYWATNGTLVIVDGEVEEMSIWAGANVFESTLQGSLLRTHDISAWNNEPVGIDIDINPTNDHFFISNDSTKTIFEIDIGSDGKFGTPDDTRRSFPTVSGDPEGLSLGDGNTLYTVDGAGRKIYVTTAGGDGIFGTGDDSTTFFDVAGMGVGDPEGVDYYPKSGTLFITDRKGKAVFEVTTSGGFIRKIDLRSIIPGILSPGDGTIAPSSDGSGADHFYIAARGVDNNDDPNENDGKIYEITIDGGSTTQPPAPPTNLTATPGDARVNLSWGASSGATSYNVKRSLASDGPFTRIASPTSTTYTDTSVSNGTTYYYVVTAANAGGESNPSNVASATPQPSSNELLKNPGFELDTNNDGKPDSWSSNARFTRGQANEVAHSGTFSGKHAATDNKGYTITQVVNGLAGGTSYTFSSWTNIPTTSDAFTFEIRIRWRNSSNSVLATTSIKKYTDDTAGAWDQAGASMTAPSGTTNAQVQMVVSSLNGTIYVDDFSLKPQ